MFSTFLVSSFSLIIREKALLVYKTEEYQNVYNISLHENRMHSNNLKILVQKGSLFDPNLA